MPALDYDYDYYEYRNGQRVGSQMTKPRSTAQHVRTTMQKTAPKRSTNAVNKKVSPRHVTESGKNRAKKQYSTTKKSVNRKTKSKIDIPLEASKKVINKPEKMTLKKAKVENKAKATFASSLRNFAFISIFFFMFFLVCYRYSIINERFNEIKKLKNELSKIETTNEQLQADIESRTDLTYVENYAKYQLGMQKPTSSQIQYVKVDKRDKITTPVIIDEEKELSGFDKLFNELRKIID